MKRHASWAMVRRDMLDEYRLRHAEVWPELLDAIRASGIRNYSLFLRDDGMLFSYFEAEDAAASIAQVAATEVSRRWQAMMQPLFETLPGRTPQQSFIDLDEVFHLD
jgi:L-rhamnose mutarotase